MKFLKTISTTHFLGDNKYNAVVCQNIAKFIVESQKTKRRQRTLLDFRFKKDDLQITDDHPPPFMAHDIAPICARFNAPICETTVSTIEKLFMNMEE